jgi:hypothetical protein
MRWMQSVALSNQEKANPYPDIEGDSGENHGVSGF